MVTAKSKATNYIHLNDLERLGILKEITGAQRDKLFIRCITENVHYSERSYKNISVTTLPVVSGVC